MYLKADNLKTTTALLTSLRQLHCEFQKVRELTDRILFSSSGHHFFNKSKSMMSEVVALVQVHSRQKNF
jgi:hypothetical protein